MTTTAQQTLLHMCLGAATQIHEECAQILSNPQDTSHNPELDLAGCGEAIVSLLGEQASRLACILEKHPRNSSANRLVLKRLDDILSIAYSKFYAFVYKDLPLCWRQLYTDSSILKFTLLLFDAIKPARADTSEEALALEDEQLSELVKTLDLALILAGAGGRQRGRRWIDEAFSSLDQLTSTDADGVLSSRRKGDKSTFSTLEPFTPPTTHPIERVSHISIEDFQSYLDNPQAPSLGPKPLVLTDLVDAWPARTTNPWDSPDYLASRTLGGRRLVPVEMGRSYVDDDWGQQLITFGELLSSYIDPSTSFQAEEQQPPEDQRASAQIAYLAQHQLLTQLPSLRSDILLPDLIYSSPPPHPTDPTKNQPQLDEPLLNAWFGPPGTITPLHTDPYHNLLVQVVGRKYVRLYSPLETERMQARGVEDGVEMGNTSLVDVGVMEGWDGPRVAGEQEQTAAAAAAAAAVRDVPFVDCILGPGDTLYIPIGWWHYVRGLSVSFSVSFWWN